MSKNWFVLFGVILAIGIVSALFTYVRSEKMAPTSEIASKGLAVVQRGNLIFYGIFMPVLVGLISFYVYRGMLVRFPANPQTVFLALAVGIGIVLTILAAVVFKMKGFFEMITLHILYVAGFGWLVPMFWVR